MSGIQWNSAQWNSAQWNGSLGISSLPDLRILYNQRDVVLKWQVVLGAVYYRYQVSMFPDFRTVFKDTLTLALSDTFTDMEADNAKRFWRWRPYSDLGVTPVQPWSAVGSYWLDTGAAEELSLLRNQWMLADPDDTADTYEFDLFPRYLVVDQNLHRIQERNRSGELLSEFLTIKAAITLFFENQQFLMHTQFHETMRFHNDIRTVYLLTYKDTEIGYPMPNIWKAEFMQDPRFTMMAAGRQDLLIGQLNFEEV